MKYTYIHKHIRNTCSKYTNTAQWIRMVETLKHWKRLLFSLLALCSPGLTWSKRVGRGNRGKIHRIQHANILAKEVVVVEIANISII